MTQSKVLKQWASLSKWPFGGWLFSKLMGWMVPYAASIDARVEALTEGHAQLRLNDRRAVRNHLKSIHAAALIHLAEMTANLALMSTQPPGSQWIVVGMSARFIKKARGPIRAQTSLPRIDWSSPQELVGTVTLLNAANEVVMTASQQWKVGQIKQEQSP